MHLPLEDTAQIRRVAATVADQFGRVAPREVAAAALSTVSQKRRSIQ
jgi:hypothetical protein